MRNLILILGDQLWLGNPALEGFDPVQDRILMIEAVGEGTHVWSHKARIAVFLSAMRHFKAELESSGMPVHYHALDKAAPIGLIDVLSTYLVQWKPAQLKVCEPGEYRLEQGILDCARAADIPVRLLDDIHFMCSRAEFARWAGRLKSLRMEFFYRDMRKRHHVLMEGDEPAGGQWNFDADNRGAYPKEGPGTIPAPAQFEPDAITREVFECVERMFPDHPGSLEHFIWPVTRAQAVHALERFIEARLPRFGDFQDAMWTDTPYGWHALLSTALNLHLLDPREVVQAAEQAWRQRQLPLASVEGFIRQVIGWREFIRGVYWTDMPALATANHYKHDRSLPKWYWTGHTRMRCMQDTVGQTLKHGFAHHIQRLMVTGNFALLAQINPQQVADWYLAVYVDAIEWVELPNVAGMALFANGGRFTSKPYVASGAYIKRMSNYCKGCAYDPAQKTGPQACPMTTLYWHFLDTHETALRNNPRTALMAKNIGRLSDEERAALRAHAHSVLSDLDAV